MLNFLDHPLSQMLGTRSISDLDYFWIKIFGGWYLSLNVILYCISHIPYMHSFQEILGNIFSVSHFDCNATREIRCGNFHL